MNSYSQLVSIIDELKASGVKPKVVKLSPKKAPKRSVFSK